MVVMEVARLKEGEWSCYRCQFNGRAWSCYWGGQFNGGKIVTFQRWSVYCKENGHVTEVARENGHSTEVASLMGGRMVMSRWPV